MLAIVTRADKNIKEMTDITHPIIKQYAKKIEADFIVLDEPKGLHPHYRILQFYELFEKYDRIISIDSDVIITPDCPNLFKIVPHEAIGTIFEDVGSRQADRRERIKKVQEKFGDIGWKSGYINTGCAVFSKCHREIFKQRELYLDLGYDDVYLGYWIRKFGFPIFQLPIKFNFMTMFAEQWNGNSQRLDNYIIHYAGNGFSGNRLGDIKRDAEIFYSDFPYPKLKNEQIIERIGEAETIYDVGCGEGLLTRYLQKKYKHAIGVDIEDNNRVGLTYVMRWDVQDEPQGIVPADVVIASEVLEHVRWWKDALRNLLKITNKKLIITVPYGRSFFDPGHINFWDDDTINEFKEIASPHKVEITKGITKPEDVKMNQLLYYITINK